MDFLIELFYLFPIHVYLILNKHDLERFLNQLLLQVYFILFYVFLFAGLYLWP